MLSITEPVRITRLRHYNRKRDQKRINLLMYTPVTGSGGEHELSIPDALFDSIPAEGEQVTLVVETYLFPQSQARGDGSHFGTWGEGRRYAGHTAPVELPVSENGRKAA